MTKCRWIPWISNEENAQQASKWLQTKRHESRIIAINDFVYVFLLCDFIFIISTGRRVRCRFTSAVIDEKSFNQIRSRPIKMRKSIFKSINVNRILNYNTIWIFPNNLCDFEQTSETHSSLLYPREIAPRFTRTRASPHASNILLSRCQIRTMCSRQYTHDTCTLLWIIITKQHVNSAPR